jgi:hypothetical protein
MTMTFFLRAPFALVFFLTFCAFSSARADRWDFLPTDNVFKPLIGDLREAQNAIIAQPDSNRYDGAIGLNIDLLHWQPNETDHWGWGIDGATFIELDSLGDAIFPNRVDDWHLGTYFTERSGNFSQRLQYEHVSSHLGDELVPLMPRIIYSRESFRYTLSYDLSQNFRLFGGPCYWSHISPDISDPRFFFTGGLELYTDYSRFLFDTHIRGYLTYYIEVLGEAGGVVDQTVQFGLEYRAKTDTHQAVRTGIILYTGNGLYGQFYQNPESYWGLGIFFDP